MRQSKSICGVVQEVDEGEAGEEEERSLAMSARRPAAIEACCGDAVISICVGLGVGERRVGKSAGHHDGSVEGWEAGGALDQTYQSKAGAVYPA